MHVLHVHNVKVLGSSNQHLAWLAAFGHLRDTEIDLCGFVYFIFNHKQPGRFLQNYSNSTFIFTAWWSELLKSCGIPCTSSTFRFGETRKKSISVTKVFPFS